MSTIQISKTIETQFLNEKKETYLQLSADFAIMRYSPKSKPALQQFISLLVLDIALLLGCDITWEKNTPPTPAQTVLEAGRASDDGDTSSASNDGGASPVVGIKGLEPGRRDEDCADAAVNPSTTTVQVAASLDDDDPIFKINMDNYITWSPMNFDQIDFGYFKRKMPEGEKICTLRSYLAIAMILWYKQDIRAKYVDVWERLNKAWFETFNMPLQASDLAKPPTDGEYGFRDGELVWLLETYRFLSKPPKKDGAAPPRRSVREKPTTQRGGGGGEGGSASRKSSSRARSSSQRSSSEHRESSHEAKKKRLPQAEKQESRF